jgi:23S rRNA (guanine745-N1)-methyltransferase
VSGRPALDRILPLLRCPICGKEPAREDGSLRCPSRHTFDIARQGYVSLLGGEPARSGDDAPMVEARRRFLATGSYDPIREAIVALATADPPPVTALDAARSGAAGSSPPVVLDVGCGTGDYLAAVLDAQPEAIGLGLDSSARALRVAARAHPRAAAATWDVFRPFPLAPASVDLVLDVFSPRNPEEFQRVLRPSGRLIVARPTADHLAQLRDHVEGMVDVDPAKEERLHRALDPGFEPLETVRVEYAMRLGPGEIADLVGMTPSARHLSAREIGARGGLPGEVGVSVLVTAYRRR